MQQGRRGDRSCRVAAFPHNRLPLTHEEGEDNGGWAVLKDKSSRAIKQTGNSRRRRGRKEAVATVGTGGGFVSHQVERVGSGGGNKPFVSDARRQGGARSAP